MKKHLILTVFTLFATLSFAQQDEQFTLYMVNTNAVNPAYTGSRGALSALALSRNQWVGFKGAPRTQSFNLNSPLLNERFGIGFTILNEQIGPLSKVGFSGDFAHRIKFKKSALAFGLKAGASVFKAGFSSLSTTSAGDEQFSTNITSKLIPNFGFGMYYLADRYYLGFSIPKLIQSKVNFKSASSQVMQIGAQKLHYFFIAGYLYDFNHFIKFRPTTQIKFTLGAPFSIDVNGSFLFYEKLWLGAMYRHEDATGIIVQFQFNSQFRAGYSYDYTLTKLNNYNNGTHEIMIGYDFIFSKEKIKSPRYF